METAALIFATLLGPVLAVQAQKWVERARQVSQRREFVFTTLMATRGARLDPDHVRALNMIDLAFYGLRLFGRPVRTQACQRVLDKWREYHSHLGATSTAFTDDQWLRFIDRGDDLLADLLGAMASERNLDFDRVTLKSGSYQPQAAGTAWREGNELRTAALDVLAGRRTLRVELQPTEVGAIRSDVT